MSYLSAILCSIALIVLVLGGLAHSRRDTDPALQDHDETKPE